MTISFKRIHKYNKVMRDVDHVEHVQMKNYFKKSKML